MCRESFYFHMGTVWAATVAFTVVFVASIYYLSERDGEMGYACLLLGRDRHAASYPYDYHREHMGKAGLGNLVDMGPAVDDHVYSLGSLRCLSGFAAPVPAGAEKRPDTRPYSP